MLISAESSKFRISIWPGWTSNTAIYNQIKPSRFSTQMKTKNFSFKAELHTYTTMVICILQGSMTC